MPLFPFAAAFALGPAESVALSTVPEGTWEVVRVVPFAGGTHVHLRPTLHGLPVDGRTRVVTLGPDGQVRRSRGVAPPAGDLDPRPVIDAGQAGAVAQGWAAFLGAPARPPRASLVARLDRGGAPRLAWAVDLAVAAPFSTWRVWVDARDARVLGHARTSFEARGLVYPTNPAVSTLTEVELQGLVAPDALVGDKAYAWSCEDFSTLGGCRAAASHAAPDGDGNYLFAHDPMSEDDPLAEVQMYHHLDLVSRWFEDRFGFTLGQPIQGLVNFPMSNAFYGDADGDGVGDVAFGQGSGVDFAYDADVIYHEFGHAVIGSVTNLGFFGADAYGIDFSPLSLNEGSADVFSMLIAGDPRLGEYAGSGFGLGAIRDLDPDRRCPQDLYGEGHEDGMIWGAVAWNVATDPQIGPEVAARLYYGAATSWSSEVVSWAEAGQSLLDTLADLRDAGVIDATVHDLAAAHVEAGGLPGCERVIPLDDGTTNTQLVIAAGLASTIGGYVPLSTQFSLDAPEGTTKLVFSIDEYFTTPASKWTVFVRRGAFVEHDVVNVLGFDVPVPAVYDFQVDGEGAGTVVIDLESDPPLEPGATYHFAVSTRADGLGAFDFGFGEATFSGRSVAGDPTGPDTPTDPAADPLADGEGSEEAGGCGCDGTGGAPLALLPVALFARRRTRARTGADAS